MTQSKLSDYLGVSFQQVQKYELGKNRLSASKIWEASVALDVEPIYFFEGLIKRKRKLAPRLKKP